MKGALLILDRIILGLQQQGWLIERGSQKWIIARKEKKGMLFAFLTSGLPLDLPDPSVLEESIDWEAIIFCPEGLSSHDMKQHFLKKIQSWYIDLQTGSIFPYPPNPKQQTLNWLLSLIEQPPTTHFISTDLSDLTPDSEVKSTTYQRIKNSPYLTYTLISINIILFLLMTLAGGSTRRDILILFGAKVNKLIVQGEVWRLVTSMFLHIGFLHLAFNLYALWTLGPITEELFGRFRYLIIYLLSGISGAVTSFLFSDALSAGASGAIFGILGALVYYTRKNSKLWNSGFGKSLIIVILINLSLGFFQPGIDNYAHLGGLISGLILGRLFPENTHT